MGLVLLCAALGSTAVLVGAEHTRQAQHRRTTRHEALSILRGSVQDVLRRETTLARVVGVLDSPIGSRWPALAQTVMSQPLANSTGFIAPVTGAQRTAFERRTGLRLVQYVRPGVFRAPRRGAPNTSWPSTSRSAGAPQCSSVST